MAPDPGPTTRAQSVADGLAARERVPRGELVAIRPAPGRDPVGLLEQQDATRVPELVPVRHARMLASPFTFFRGAALPMAADLATAPTTGLRVQLCGDAHLSNFGFFASPERRLVFDLNDFDETLPGPFEWDVARLVASVSIVGRESDLSRKKRRRVVLATAAAYREAMAAFAAQPFFAVWYARLDVEAALERFQHGMRRSALKRTAARIAKARRRDGMHALSGMTEVVGGRRRIVPDPPLVVPIEDLPGVDDPDQLYATLREVVAGYTGSLAPERRRIVEQFTLTQVARKVVGVGSVGRRAWVLLLEPHDGLDPLVLQAKEASRSVLADHAGDSVHENQGERVVVGQRLLQAVSDVLLGWQRAPGVTAPVDYYLRQLRDWKYGIEVDELDEAGLTTYARFCAWTLARGHARTGDRVAIAAYLGESRTADEAFADFAERYADLTRLDHAALQAAVDSGRTSAARGE